MEKGGNSDFLLLKYLPFARFRTGSIEKTSLFFLRTKQRAKEGKAGRGGGFSRCLNEN